MSTHPGTRSHALRAALRGDLKPAIEAGILPEDANQSSEKLTRRRVSGRSSGDSLQDERASIGRVASIRISSILPLEGRRGTSVWQRRRLLSDILVCLIRDLRQRSRFGVEPDTLLDLVQHLERVRASGLPLLSSECGVIIEPAISQLISGTNELAHVHGNGPQQVVRERIVKAMALDRRSAAKAARESFAFKQVRLKRAFVDAVVAELEAFARRHTSEFPLLCRALDRYSSRAGPSDR